MEDGDGQMDVEMAWGCRMQCMIQHVEYSLQSSLFQMKWLF